MSVALTATAMEMAYLQHKCTLQYIGGGLQQVLYSVLSLAPHQPILPYLGPIGLVFSLTVVAFICKQEHLVAKVHWYS